MPRMAPHRWLLQVVKARAAQSGGDSKLLPTRCFTAPQLEMLRHAFELLCTDTTAGESQGVSREQVVEIMVMAGLDLSSPDTINIITQLVRATTQDLQLNTAVLRQMSG
jgi:hypothetical protein